ncbi:MAG: two-component regulator propeller domain-containing protein, partial [Fibrobacterota bacterium]
QESEVRWLKSGQWGFEGPAVVSDKKGNNHCVKHDKKALKSDYQLNRSDSTIYPASARFIRALVMDKNGKVAQTMPFKIISPDSIESYYPGKGEWYRGQTHNHCDPTGRKKRGLHDYHLAYRKIGHAWSFATDYGFWLTPFQMHREESIPVITGVYPVHVKEGETTECTIVGRYFGNNDKVYIGSHLIKVSKWLYETRLSISLPGNLEPGVYDLTLTTPEGYNSTLPDCIAVQERNADNGGWTTFTTINSSLPSDKILCVKARNNEVWVGTQYGAVRIKDNAWKKFTRDDYPQQIGDAILDIAFDSKNKVYLSHFRGLTVLSPNDSLRLLRTEQGLLSREINQVMVAANDDIWVSYNGGSNQISRSRDNGNHWEHFTPPNIEGCALGIALAEDRLGRILFSTPGKGVAVFDNNGWRIWNTANSGLADDYVHRIFVDKENRIYFATTGSGTSPQGGLSVLKDNHWQSYTQDKGRLASYRVWDVLVSRNGSVWCSTSRGVSCLNKAGQWKTYTMTNSGLASNVVLCATEDADGALWFATDKGLSRFQPQSQ